MIAPDGARRTSTGKPDEIEKLMSGLGRGCRKSATLRQFADSLLYVTSGLAGEENHDTGGELIAYFR